jgi:hypothetical protein
VRVVNLAGIWCMTAPAAILTTQHAIGWMVLLCWAHPLIKSPGLPWTGLVSVTMLSEM